MFEVGSSHTIEIRVGYHETDGQQRVHHGNYLNYFERGRVEMLRAIGISYKTFEESGMMLVVSEMNIKYLEFDDILSLTTTLVGVGKVRLEHRYEISRQNADGDIEPIVEAVSTIACVDASGRPRRLTFSV